MKQLIISSFGAMLVAGGALAQAVEKDLPKDKKAGEALKYYHDSTPLNAYHSIYSDIYIHKWLDAPHDGMEPISKAEQDRISDTFIAHARANNKYDDLLNGLIYREKWDEALEVAPKAIAHYEELGRQKKRFGWDQVAYGYAYMNWADALMGKGLVDEARAKLDEVIAADIKWAGYYNGGRARYPNPTGEVRDMRFWFDPNHMDALKLPRGNEGVAFPEPQVAKYLDKYAKAEAIDLYLDGVDVHDARVKLLAFKLKRRGFRLNGGDGRGKGYALTIALDGACKVDRPEGYTLEATAKGCEIRARDKQGVLWGIVSFLQILDKEGKRMRLCSIEDWPASPKRGFFGRPWGSTLEYAVFNKLNYVTLKPCYLSLAGYTPLNLHRAKTQAKEFNDLGLTLYYGFMNMTMDVAWPLCWNVNLARMIEDAKTWASCGVGIYYPYDDARYWESTTWTEEDRASGLKPSDTDAKFIAKLYTAVKAEYPDFKMQFCPPFYWGPNAGHPYPDNREKYLKSIAEHLPKEIDVIWTGERVGSHKKEEGAVKWYSNLIGREPSLFQNKTGPHNYLSYIADATRWQDWYYDGFVDRDMRSIQKNSDTPQECPQIATLADYCWNPKAYDEYRSIKRGLDNYAGPGLYELLKPARDILAHFDRYKYGNINLHYIWEDREQIQKDLEFVKETTKKAKELVGEDFFNTMGAWGGGVGFMEKVVRETLKRPTFEEIRKKQEPYVRNVIDFATTNSSYNAKSDKLLWALDFRPIDFCYHPNKNWGSIPESRIYAEFGGWEVGTATFKLAKRETTGERKLIISVKTTWPKMKIELNGKLIHEGMFKGYHWSKNSYTHEFPIPAGTLKAGDNELVIRNDSAAVNLCYVIIR